MNQTDFAAKFGLKQAVYSHYENGRREPSLDILVRMAEILGCTTDYLLGLSSDPKGNVVTADHSAVAIGNGANATVTIKK